MNASLWWTFCNVYMLELITQIHTHTYIYVYLTTYICQHTGLINTIKHQQFNLWFKAILIQVIPKIRIVSSPNTLVAPHPLSRWAGFI